MHNKTSCSIIYQAADLFIVVNNAFMLIGSSLLCRCRILVAFSFHTVSNCAHVASTTSQAFPTVEWDDVGCYLHPSLSWSFDVSDYA